MVGLPSFAALLQALLVAGTAWAAQAARGAQEAPGAIVREDPASVPSGKTAPQETPPREFPLLPDRESLPLVDFRWLEILPSVGVGVFTEDFDIDPGPYLSVMARAPMPWLSPDSDPVGEYLGVFVEATLFPRLERGIEPELENPSGSFLFFSGGLDFTLVRDGGLLLMARGGGLYGWYGGITNLDDGFAGLAGLTAGFRLGKGLTLTVDPDVIFARAGDRIYRGSLGLLVEF